MENKKPFSVNLSLPTWLNLERWAKAHEKSVDDATNYIIQRYLTYEDFYEAPKENPNFYLSPCKLGICRVLSVAGMNLGQIAKRLAKPYDTVQHHIEKLKLAGVVTERKYGRNIRFFTLNLENPLTQRIMEVVNLWYKPEKAIEQKVG